MDRQNITQYLVLPILFYFLLSTSLIGVTGYMLVATGSNTIYAQEDNSVVDIEPTVVSTKNNRVLNEGEKPVDDPRINAINKYISDYETRTGKNSFLSGKGDILVSEADKYEIDWWIVTAIALAESGLGTSKTAIETNNAWGWQIYGDNVRELPGVEEAISEVSDGLYSGYYAKGRYTLDEIAAKYVGVEEARERWIKNVRSAETEIKGNLLK